MVKERIEERVMKSLSVLTVLISLTLATAAVAQDAVGPEQAQADPSLASTGSSVLPIEGGLSIPEQRPSAHATGGSEGGPKTEGLIPHVLVGPKLSLITLPTPGVGLELKAFGYLGASFDYGFIPEVRISTVNAKLTMWNVGAKVYPFKGAFFVGAALGAYELSARSNVTDQGSGATVPARATVRSTFLAPQLGFRWVGSSGFFTSFDLGWAFPRSYASTLTAPPGVNAGTVQDIRENADEYVKDGIPLLGLGLGWFL